MRYYQRKKYKEKIDITFFLPIKNALLRGHSLIKHDVYVIWFIRYDWCSVLMIHLHSLMFNRPDSHSHSLKFGWVGSLIFCDVRSWWFISSIWCSLFLIHSIFKMFVSIDSFREGDVHCWWFILYVWCLSSLIHSSLVMFIIHDSFVVYDVHINWFILPFPFLGGYSSIKRYLNCSVWGLYEVIFS